jgi:hypothetical protein
VLRDAVQLTLGQSGSGRVYLHAFPPVVSLETR